MNSSGTAAGGVDIYNTNKKYSVIYADPPWLFKNKKTGGSMTSGSNHQYKSVMGIEDLKKMPIANIADDNCLLVMWYVGSMPQEAIDLVDAWGFRLINMNGFVWNKLTRHGLPFFGMGFYTRAGSEPAIIAVKKKGSFKPASRSVRAVLTAPVGKHSAKPHGFYDRIEQLAGECSKIELFARNTRANWDSFGNQL